MNEKEFNKEKINMAIDEHKKNPEKAVKAFTRLVVNEAIKYYGENIGFGNFNIPKRRCKSLNGFKGKSKRY